MFDSLTLSVLLVGAALCAALIVPAAIDYARFRREQKRRESMLLLSAYRDLEDVQ